MSDADELAKLRAIRAEDKTAWDNLIDRNRVIESERDAALAKLDDLERAIADLSHPNMRLLLAERDALLAREIPKDPTPDGLLYRYRNDRLFHELVDQLALSKFMPERDRLCAERDSALALAAKLP
jgi:hypothetical protein